MCGCFWLELLEEVWAVVWPLNDDSEFHPARPAVKCCFFIRADLCHWSCTGTVAAVDSMFTITITVISS